MNLDLVKAALSVKWDRISLKKVGIQGILGGVTVYGAAKAGGLPEAHSVVLGLLSALTSAYAGGVDPSHPTK